MTSPRLTTSTTAHVQALHRVGTLMTPSPWMSHHTRRSRQEYPQFTVPVRGEAAYGPASLTRTSRKCRKSRFLPSIRLRFRNSAKQSLRTTLKFQRRKILFNAEHASTTKDQTETFCVCGSTLPGITEEVQKQEEQRMNSRFIIYVPVIDKLALTNTQTSRLYGHSADSSPKKARDYFDSAKKRSCAKRLWCTTSRTCSIKCACTFKDTRNFRSKTLTD